MQYCKECIMPSTRPEQVFKDGVCDACTSKKTKHEEIDWDQRKKEFEQILDKYRGDGSRYDCIIPVSGGKDSCYQAITMRDEFGMTPLCVNHVPCDLTEVGQQENNNTFSLVRQENGIAHLIMDVKGDTMKTLKAEFSDEIAEVLTEIREDKAITGLVLVSGKADSFVAGAEMCGVITTYR